MHQPIETDLTVEERRKLWTDALRSGEYQQGTLRLKRQDNTYCCLGVACEVYQKHVGGLEMKETDSGIISYNEESSVLPNAVKEWLNITSHGQMTEPQEYRPDEEGTPYLYFNLTSVNDCGKFSFEQIADIIDSGKLVNCDYVI